MSWDIILAKTATNDEAWKNIDKNTIPFESAKVIPLLKANLNNIEIDEDGWLNYEGENYSISASLSDDIYIILDVSLLDDSAENKAIEKILEFCNILNCRAYDTASDSFIDKERMNKQSCISNSPAPKKRSFFGFFKKK